MKTDTANIGKGEELKRTATILSNLAQNFGMFIGATMQLSETDTLPINLDINDLAVSRTVKEVLDKILRYKNYIIPSGGGVTVSGGEPLLHLEFLKALFTELKKEGISTAVDTSGVFYLTPGIKEVIELTDLFLLDIKCINDEICRDLTGVSNQKELEFARYLSENGKHMWIRQVLVPGYTDKEEDLIKLKEFLATLKTVDKVEILPYHDMGRFKWEQLGLEYPLDGVRVANNEDVERAKKLLGV